MLSLCERVLAGLLMLPAMAAADATFDLYVESNPPFVQMSDGQLSGAMGESLVMLVRAQGLLPRVRKLPLLQAVSLVERQPGACVFPVDYTAGRAESLNYVARVAPMPMSAYARRGEVAPLEAVADLKRYRVASYDVEALRGLLEQAGVSYLPLIDRAKAVEMLAAKRFDILVGDAGAALRGRSQGVALDIVLSLPSVELWLACNPQTPQRTVERLRQALRSGVFAESVRPVWARYGLADFYRQGRSAGLGVSP